MKHFEITYNRSSQEESSIPFPNTKEGIARALKSAKDLEKQGYVVTPSSIIIKHKLNHLK